MKKTEKKRDMARGHNGRARLDWTPVWDAFGDMIDWALDVGVGLASDADEVEAVENVRDFVRARLDDEPASVRVDDLVFTLGRVVGALDRDLGLDGLAQRLVAEMAASLGAGRIGSSPRVIRVPPAHPPSPRPPVGLRPGELEHAFEIARQRLAQQPHIHLAA